MLPASALLLSFCVGTEQRSKDILIKKITLCLNCFFKVTEPKKKKKKKRLELHKVNTGL